MKPTSNFRQVLAICACSVMMSAAALAATINFEEFPADNDNGGMPASRYASLGITFIATDDGLTWAGLGGGDPGNWAITGTSGDTFSGFNGDSYGLTTTFTTPVKDFRLDVSRSNGSAPGDTFTLEGWRDGAMVETHTVNLATINQWQTVSLAQIVDKTRWAGAGADFHPFGIDNVQWTVVPEPSTFAVAGLGAAVLVGLRRRM